jgi:hypothetical protein
MFRRKFMAVPVGRRIVSVVQILDSSTRSVNLRARSARH